MPRTNALTDEQKVQQRVINRAEDLDMRLHKAHISKQAIADITGLTRQAVSNQFRIKRILPEVTEAAELLLERVNN